MGTTGHDTTISYRVELLRKAIHLSSISIPIFYFFTPRIVALSVLVPLTVIFMAIDVARHYNQSAEERFYRTFGRLLRSREADRAKKRLNGATYVLISATLCVFLFPKLIAIISFLILIISDMMSALIGRQFGKHRFLGKSLEGSMAFFISAVLIVVFTPKVSYLFGEYLIGGISAMTGAIVEALPWEIDDNLTVPLAVGGSMWALYALLYPYLPVDKFG